MNKRQAPNYRPRLVKSKLWTCTILITRYPFILRAKRTLWGARRSAPEFVNRRYLCSCDQHEGVSSEVLYLFHFLRLVISRRFLPTFRPKVKLMNGLKHE